MIPAVLHELTRSAMRRCPGCGVWFAKVTRRKDAEFCTRRCAKTEMQRRTRTRRRVR